MIHEVLTAKEVAERLRCSEKTIRDDAEKRWPNFPKAIRIGRLKRWIGSEIDAYIKLVSANRARV